MLVDEWRNFLTITTIPVEKFHNGKCKSEEITEKNPNKQTTNPTQTPPPNQRELEIATTIYL